MKGIVTEQFLLQGHLLQLEVEGTGFLYRQVRNMVHDSLPSQANEVRNYAQC